jgi:hypothetical protein
VEIGEDAGSASEEPPAVADDGVEPEVAAPSPELAAELVDSTETEPEPEMVAAPQPEPEPEVVAAPEPEPEPAPVAASEVEAAPKGEAVPEVAPEADAAPAAPAVSVAETATAADLESIAALTAAAQNPALEFQASTQLGRLLLRLGRSGEGIEWLERATRAETSVRERRLEVMYELADALELAGDRARALDVFADLDFDAASFRDVPERMATLRRALGEGGAT